MVPRQATVYSKDDGVGQITAGHHATDGAPENLCRRAVVEGTLTRIGVPQGSQKVS